ncbi:hypothetical protein ACP4OV_012340 [Aristida adscensionis]
MRVATGITVLEKLHVPSSSQRCAQPPPPLSPSRRGCVRPLPLLSSRRGCVPLQPATIGILLVRALCATTGVSSRGCVAQPVSSSSRWPAGGGYVVRPGRRPCRGCTEPQAVAVRPCGKAGVPPDAGAFCDCVELSPVPQQPPSTALG